MLQTPHIPRPAQLESVVLTHLAQGAGITTELLSSLHCLLSWDTDPRIYPGHLCFPAGFSILPFPMVDRSPDLQLLCQERSRAGLPAGCTSLRHTRQEARPLLVLSETEGSVLSPACSEHTSAGRRTAKEFSVAPWRRPRLDFIVGRVFLAILLLSRLLPKSPSELLPQRTLSPVSLVHTTGLTWQWGSLCLGAMGAALWPPG